MVISRYDSQSSAVSSGSSMKLHVRKAKKPSSGLDDALESLHSEPSGWGDLPSPKLTDVDNGTEIWGVAPDDMHRKSRGCNGTYSFYCIYCTIEVKKTFPKLFLFFERNGGVVERKR